MISTKDYEDVKKFYTFLKLSNLGELNKLCNFQDTIILCEIFEQRSDLLKQIFKYNPRKCNSASSFSGCVHRNKSKCCIALSTDADFVRVFEKTLVGGFSFKTCFDTKLAFDTRLAFDTDILGNDPKTEKVLVEVTIDGKKQLKRFSSKIIKMDENNQYGQAMTKPLPYDCIKKQKEIPTLTQFNKILNSILHEDNIDHIFTVDPSYYLMRCIRLYLKKIKKLILLKGQHYN